MSEQPPCPKCKSTYTYLDRDLLTCPECGHEWSANDAGAGTAAKAGADKDAAENFGPTPLVVKDAHGNILQDGDSITVIKELKIKGSSSVVKIGTKVKSIRLVESDNGHNIDCKIAGIGSIQLKSEFVKK